jgi:HNH endonuclease/AP2 domain
MLTRRRLKEVLHYDPATGDFTRLTGRFAGTLVRKRNQDGRIQVKIDGRYYLTARLVFLWKTGRLPKKLVDHRDVDPTNDRWENLRHATNAQNCRNTRRYSNNTTGFKGVSFHKRDRKFQANIRKDGRLRFLGSFATGELAHEAYKKAAKKLFGAFARFE